ncbi:MAG: Hpt domain-containing protein [Xanthomonadales bacterium]|nr:Hpt domain-containing protein [Xanthomonadales bacterium]
MKLHDDIDFTTLSWVKQELDETLKQARQALEAYVEDTSDTSQMRFCATYLHQVQGTLRMVELYGAALVVEEMEHVALGLLEDEVADTDEAYAMLMRGIVQLPDYLERLQGGHRDIPVVLLPLLNDLRSVRGQKLLSETALFSPRLEAPLPEIADGPAAPLDDRTLRVAAAKIRKVFESSLLHWFKAEADVAMINRLHKLCDKLRQITFEENLRRVFWVAEGVLDGIRNDALDPGSALKVLFGKLDRVIKQMALHGEGYFAERLPEDLLKGLLYYAAHADSGSEHLDAVKATFNLDELMPDADELEHAKGAIAGHNRELLSTVSGAIKEDLMRVKDALDLKVRQNDMTTEGFDEQSETLHRVGDTLGMLGLGIPRKVVQEQRDKLEELIGSGEVNENAMLDIAGSLLIVESSLDDHIEQLGSPTRPAEEAAEPDPMPDLPKSEIRRILDALMKEASGNLQVIKQNIVEFIEAPWDHEKVGQTPALLEEIVGALKMLDLDEAASLLNGIVAYTQVELLKKRNVPDAEELDTVADAVASLEYYLEAVREHRPGRDKILEVARQSLRKLGYYGEDSIRSMMEAAEQELAESGEAAEVAPETIPEAGSETEAPADAMETQSLDSFEAEPAETEPSVEAAAEESLEADISEEIDDEIKEVFIEEVEEELVNLSELFPQWKSNPDDQEALTTIRRTFHTLKGSGRLVGAYTIGEFSWEIENMLNRVLDQSIAAGPELVDLMGHAVEALPGLLANVKGEGRPTADIEGIKSVANKLANGETVRFEPTAAPAEEVAEAEPEAVESEEPVLADVETEPQEVTETIDAVEEAPAEEAEADLALADDLSLDDEPLELADDFSLEEEPLELAEEAAEDLLAADSGEALPDATTEMPSVDDDEAATDVFESLQFDGELLDADLDLPALEEGESAEAETVSDDLSLLPLEDEEGQVAETEGGEDTPEGEEEAAVESTDFDFDLGDLELEPLEGEPEPAAGSAEISGLAEFAIDDPAMSAESEHAEAEEAPEEIGSAHAEEPAAEAGLELEPLDELSAETDEGAAVELSEDDSAEPVETAELDDLDDLDDLSLDDLDDLSLEGPEAEAEEGEAADAAVEADGLALSPDLELDDLSLEPLEDEAAGAGADEIAAADEMDDLLGDLGIDDSDQEQELMGVEGDSSEADAFDADLEAFINNLDEPETEEAEAPAEEAAVGGMDPVLREILRTEVTTHLGTIKEYMGACDDAGHPVSVGEPMVRSVHTLNGAIAMVDLPEITALTGPLEGYVKRLNVSDQAPDNSGLDAIRQTVSTIETVLDQLEAPELQLPDTEALSQQLGNLRDALPESESFTGAFADELSGPEMADRPEEFDESDLVDDAAAAAATIPVAGDEEAQPFDLDFDMDFAESEADAEETTAEDAGEALPDLGLDDDAVATAIDADDIALDDLELVSSEDLEGLELVDLVDEESISDAGSDAGEGPDETVAEEEPAVEPAAEADEGAEEPVAEVGEDEAELAGETEDEAEAMADDQAAGDEQAEAEPEPEPELEAELEVPEEMPEPAAETEVDAEAEAEAEAEPGETVDESDEAAVPVDEAGEAAGEAIAELASDLEAWERSGEELAGIDADDETVDMSEFGDIDDELLDIFLQEGSEILDAADHKMAEWRDNQSSHEPVVELQRELHTLKGGARMAGLSPIGDLSHAMESLFEGVVEERVATTDQTVEILELAFDRLHLMLDKVQARDAIPTGRAAINQIEALIAGKPLEAPEAEAEQEAPADEKAEKADKKAEKKASKAEKEEKPQEPDQPEAEPSEPEPEEPAAEEAKPKPKPKPKPKKKAPKPAPTALDEEVQQRGAVTARPQQELIRVRADLLDNLVNYAGEVSIYRSRLEQQIGTFRFNLVEFDQTVNRLREQLRKLEIETEAQILSRYQREAEEMDEAFDPLELDRFSTLQQLSRGLAESVSDLVSIQGMLDDLTRQSETLLLQQSRVNSDLQEGLMRTRMVPFDSLVPRLRRILRQTSKELEKKAHLRVEGAQGEMDRTVLERITAPLEHMLRNAVAHGLESPEQREQSGKDPEGEIKLGVTREATEVVITVEDDGSGIDHERVRAKALERGLLKEDSELTDRDLFGFILETGFTTAQQVTKVAGRGVGLDVVNSEIKQLGGSLDITSDRGQGTRFTIRLPFTLAVTHAIMVRVGDSTFAIPLTSIQGVVRMNRHDFDRRMDEGETVYEYTGEEYQLKELAVLLGLERKDHGEDDMVPVLMSRIGDQRAAIRVDAVMGSREIVVKSVGPQISSIPGIFGATILGDGSVIMILDLGPLIRRGAALQLTTEAKGADEEAVEVVQEEEQVPLIMVVDDSITMRKVTSRVLQRHDMEVITAKDGVDAVEQLQDRIPDLMLLDIEMPRMDGFEVATHMKSDDRLKGIPIIMITSRTGEKHRERALDIGVNRYLGKPYQEAELLTNVQELLDEAVETG